MKATPTHPCPTCGAPKPSGRQSYCSDSCRPRCAVRDCTAGVTGPGAELCSLHYSRQREGSPLRRECEKCGVLIEGQPKKTRRCVDHNFCDVDTCTRRCAIKGLCEKHYKHLSVYGKTHTSCVTCGIEIDDPRGGATYCSDSCRPVCAHPTCDKPARGADDVCSWHQQMRARYGELRPDTWTKDWVCVVCGKDVERNSGRRKHCSVNCAQVDLQARKRSPGVSRPKVATCRLCGRDFSLIDKTPPKRSRGKGITGPRLQRTDTVWCRDCDRESPEVKRMVRYGVTPDQYAAALLMGCDICGSSDPKLHVDHDHACCPTRGGHSRTCGKCVRGFLCGPCNRALGMMKDDPERLRRAIGYLEKYTSANNQ